MDVKAEEKILAKYRRDTGYRAPEGFLDAAFEKISAAKGDLPKAPELKPRTRWQIVRPYVYLAAMFAGIWCTMKILATYQSVKTAPFFQNVEIVLGKEFVIPM
jgi:hypothetical protein